MSDMRSGHSLSTYLVLLIQSGIPHYSPNSLPMTSKTNSTHGFLTFYTLVANVWLSSGLDWTASLHLLSLSRLECPKAVFWAQSYSCSSSMISLTLENPISLLADDSTLCHDIPHPSETPCLRPYSVSKYPCVRVCVCVCHCKGW